MYKEGTFVAIFAKDIIGRDVVGRQDERLGELKDVAFDTATGSVMSVRVRIEADIDPSKLPWSMVDGLIEIPVEDISRIATKIHLKR
jgi:sporulation protein YlmC with PRC-barrel domain